MKRLPRALILAALSLLVTCALVAAEPADPLAPWQAHVTVRPVGETLPRHTIHTYFNLSPESPDGRWVLFYASKTADSHRGELRVIERATGKEELLVDGLETEDAHRAACQQWISGGKRVAFHNVRDGRWSVSVVDMDTRQVRKLADDRQLCWGAATGDLLPVYGCHWNPGEHRDLELIDAGSGQIRTAVTAEEVAKTHPQWIAKTFGDRPVSIFFPVMSPDGRRVFFKMATPAGGDFRSSKASQRQGLVAYDLQQSKFLFLRQSWGHPAWSPDSRQIIEAGNVLLDGATGAAEKIAGPPRYSSSHPAFSPDARLFTADLLLERSQGLTGPPGHWAVIVARADGSGWQELDRFDNTRGARSWRVSHPHPVFSPDGRRIYFNKSADGWTRLYVAEKP